MKYFFEKSYINGSLINSAQFYQEQNFGSISSYENETGFVTPLPTDITLDIELFDSRPIDIQLGVPLTALGPGHICHYCQSYTPRGKYLCPHCNARLVQVDFIKPANFPFICTDNIIDSVMWGDMIMQTFSFRAVSEVDYSLMMSLSQGLDLSLSAEFAQITPGYYLCHYCGTVTPDNDSCEACGGNRLPFQELVDMWHECLYCGNETVNGIVCNQCGARMGGLAYSDVTGNDPLKPFFID